MQAKSRFLVGVCFVACFKMLLLWKHFYSEFATFNLVFADRRATARTTTFVEPCSIQIKKTTSSFLVPINLMLQRVNQTLKG